MAGTVIRPVGELHPAGQSCTRQKIFDRCLFVLQTHGQRRPSAVRPLINIQALRSPECRLRTQSSPVFSSSLPCLLLHLPSSEQFAFIWFATVFPNHFLSHFSLSLCQLEPHSCPISPPYLSHFVPSYFIVTLTLIRLPCPLLFSYFFLLFHPFSSLQCLSILLTPLPPVFSSSRTALCL